MSSSVDRRPIIDSLVVFLIACVLILPLFKREYLDNWGSIESTFIGDARILREHLPHPGWQPLWYCGTRFDYVYPPALRYGTALTSLALRVSTARAYHIYIAILYAIGIMGVYWLAYAGSGSRLQAWLAALLTAVLSPSLLLMNDLQRDSPDWVPQRLHVLITYGEGPHISALALLGCALAASFVALRQWRPVFLALAGILSAAVVSNNFYGATALALLFPIATWAVYLEVRRPAVFARAAGIAAIAYGLCAFWLTPSYIKITQLNLRWVATPGKPWCIAVFIGCAIAYVLLTSRLQAAWPVFLAGAAFFTSLYVLGWYYFGFSVTGNAMRLAPELDLALILLLAFCFALMWKRPVTRIIAVVLLLATSYPALHYMHVAWRMYPRATHIEERPEYQTTKWLNDNLPGARALSSGSIRFWYDTWFNIAEAYGGSDQGMLNQLLPAANWQIMHGEKPDVAVAWLQAMGVDAIIVPDKTSPEVYHDYTYPEKFRGVLPVLYDDHKGDVIYRIPRRYHGLARVVETAAFKALTPPAYGDDMQSLGRYVDAIEHGPDSTPSIQRLTFETLEVTAAINPGQSLLISRNLRSRLARLRGRQTRPHLAGRHGLHAGGRAARHAHRSPAVRDPARKPHRLDCDRVDDPVFSVAHCRSG